MKQLYSIMASHWKDQSILGTAVNKSSKKNKVSKTIYSKDLQMDQVRKQPFNLKAEKDGYEVHLH